VASAVEHSSVRELEAVGQVELKWRADWDLRDESRGCTVSVVHWAPAETQVVEMPLWAPAPGDWVPAETALVEAAIEPPGTDTSRMLAVGESGRCWEGRGAEGV
jgi:hypothetical protein